MANPLYGSGPLRSREGLISRSAANSDEIQLRIDPMHVDLDEEISVSIKRSGASCCLCSNILGLMVARSFICNQVAQEIETEAKFQNDIISQLQMTTIKAQAALKNNMRRMNKSIIQHGSNHVVHVILFALFCFFVVYLLSKFSGS
uniref:Bet1-like protein At4g14600 n=1 Tax=Elaeis guineensis var. tenera TaxID=51953 RepID=A0A6I9RHH7_ELAGV|nr:bet1-like protein At4g14600 [Elaeis guineensis]